MVKTALVVVGGTVVGSSIALYVRMLGCLLYVCDWQDPSWVNTTDLHTLLDPAPFPLYNSSSYEEQFNVTEHRGFLHGFVEAISVIVVRQIFI